MTDIAQPEITQGSQEWFEVRAGKATASRISDIIARTKSGSPSASRKNYAAQLVCERLTGEVAESYTSKEMLWGIEKEPQARAAYAFLKDAEVSLVGFVDHPSIEMSGASPDGLVGDNGLIEIKCPNTSTHIETLRGAAIDKKYMTQMQWQMACTDRKWCDFVSYDPRLPTHLAIFVKRVSRDDVMIRELEAEVSAFLKDVAQMVSDLNEMELA